MYILQWTIRDGSRVSTAKAFLRPARDRENLDIAMNAHVQKVSITLCPKSRVNGGGALPQVRIGNFGEGVFGTSN